MTEPKLKVDFGEIAKNMSKAIEEDKTKDRTAKKRHNVRRGEYVEDVDPAVADKHLED